MAKQRKRVPLSHGWAESDDSDRVWVGDRLVNRIINVEFEGVDGQPGLNMTLDSSDGVPRVTRLEVASVKGGREVRTTDIRAVKLEDWIEAIVPAFSHRAERVGDEVRVYIEVDPAHQEAVKAIRTAKRADRRKVDDPAFLRRVAEAYESDEMRPAETVQRTLGGTRRTAYRWISLAREKTDPTTGKPYLPPRKAQKGGE